MYGRLKQLTACCVLIVFLVPSNVQMEEVQKISQAVLKQNDILRNIKSKEMLKYMNLSADPCQDFYAYACGNWAKYHVPPRENEVKTPLLELEQKVEHDLINLLEDQAPLSDSFNGRKVKDFYKSCKETFANGQQQHAFHSEVIKNHGGFPAAPGSNWALYSSDYDWVQVVAYLRHQFSMDILIGIDVVVNPYNKVENTVYLTEPSTIIPSDFCSAEGTRQIDLRHSEYQRIETEVATNLQNWLSLEQPKAAKVAGEILLFELELCTAMQLPELSNGNQTNRPLVHLKDSLYALTKYFNNSINFDKFMSTCCVEGYAKQVAIRSERYFQHLIHTISIHDKAMLANYIMYRALSMLSFPLQDNKQNRPKFCAQMTKRYFRKVVGFMYYQKYAHSANKLEIEKMFENLKVAFESSLKSPWLQNWTSRKGLEKLRHIVLHFPTYEEKPALNNLIINANHFWENLNRVMPRAQEEESERIKDGRSLRPNDEVEAYELRMKYDNDFLRIDVGWALLQPPLFQEVYPNSVHYAMIGQMLGHELATAFDDVGWSSDVLYIANWDLETAVEYFNRSECFRRQISNYLSNNVATFQNVTELRELTKKISSLNVAFGAYLQWLAGLNSNNDYQILIKETLPGLNFSNTQLFFIAFAQSNCQTQKNDKAVAACCPLQSHTLARYRVNGPLSNSFEFGREFQCKIGSQMNAAEKCFIY